VQILKKSGAICFSILTGLLLAFSFPKFNFEFLAWFGFVPLLFAIEGRRGSESFWLGFLAGLFFYFIGLHWIINTLVNFGNISPFLGYPILLLLTAYLSTFIGLFSWIISSLSHKNPRNILLAPLLWTTFEYLRSTHSELGFSWLGLGYSQYKNLPAIQISEFTGIYGVSALLVLTNSAIYMTSRQWVSSGSFKDTFSKKYLISTISFASIMLIGSFCYGFYYLKNSVNEEDSQIKATLIQGNIDQKLKWEKKYRKKIMETYERLTITSVHNKPDIVIWPEAALPFFYNLEIPETLWLNKLNKSLGIPMLIGGQRLEKNDLGKYIYYNSAYFLKPDSIDKTRRYDKIHLVPFGEFIPFSDILSFIKKLVYVPGELGRGEKISLFELDPWKFGVSICYEITFPDLVRKSAKKGAQFLVTITNDAWFGDSAASYQHIAIAALRAVENRTPILRAANTGITGTIDASGKIYDETNIFIEDAVQTSIRPRQGKPTYYSQNGDIFSLCCVILSIILVFIALRTGNKNFSKT
jgi:apolipoprotein N-acyltransferase